MARIIIISDPYRRRTEFQSWEDEWQSISETNPHSKLLHKKFTEGFFPFKAREIVDILLDEYGDDTEPIEPIEILFEGPDDEWTELRDVCAADDLKGKVSLDRSERFLTNARDILPLIRDVFDELYPIIAGQSDGSPETQEQLRKFREASSNVIPICVVGNYSAGKSSFINALIGIELLPSGDRPVTARIFQIERSSQQDRALIKFKLAGENVHVRITNEGIRITPTEAKGELIDSLKASGADAPDLDITSRARVLLDVFNTYKEQDREHPMLSDLVEVEVPFGRLTDWDTGKKVVIFDTPGSNSSTNQDHSRVLAEAMRGMSDGLPIYVTIYDALDSTDNANLYEDISKMPALDERFAMIVVNKSDDADLPEDGFIGHKDWIMDTVIARNLYAQGIYFVSSIAGLASKTGGEFSDRHYDRLYRRLRDSFEDPDDKYYMRLFDFNLMPEQLRVKSIQESEDSPNLVLANSGFLSVEQGIDDFATKYSAYNKCFQSGALLQDLIEQTDDSLEAKNDVMVSSWSILRDDLMSSKEDLFDGLLERSRAIGDEAKAGYLPSMNDWAKEALDGAGLSPETLSAWEQAITAKVQRKMGAEESRKDAEGKRAAVTENLMSRVQSAWDTKNVLGLASIAKSFANDINAAREAESQSESIFRGADKEASEALLDQVRARFDADVATLSQEAEEHSKEYWSERAEAARASLLDFITNGTTIDDTARANLRNVVINYQDLALNVDQPELREVRNLFNPNKLWKAPLRIQYNMELSQRISMWRVIIEPAHIECFQNWLHDLTDLLIESAEEINPELKKKVDAVRSTEREMEILQYRRERLHRGEKTILGYMSWKEE